MSARARFIACIVVLSAQATAIAMLEIALVRAWHTTEELQTNAGLAWRSAEGWKTLANFWKQLAGELAADDGKKCSAPIEWGRPTSWGRL